MKLVSFSMTALAFLGGASPATAESAQSTWQQGEVAKWRLHAVGAQVYECKADTFGHLVWQFREPVAVLMDGATSVGNHFAGPTWLVLGIKVTGKAVESVADPSGRDIPDLKLAVTNPDGNGFATVLRLNSTGGRLEGACDAAGGFQAVPYSAEYVFLKK